MKSNLRWSAVWIGVLITLFVWIALFFTFSIKVPVGYSAIKVDIYGKNVEPKGLHTGRNFYNVITHDVFKYPIFIQQAEYLDLVFQDTDGLKITADIGMDYKFDEAKIGSIYEQYKADVNKMTNTYMKTWVKNAVNRASSEFQVDKLYGPDKEKFRLRVLENLKEDLDVKGIIVNNVYFTNEMDLPDEVKGRINAKIQATQNAMQKENELRAVEADAKKKIAEAKGIADSAVEKAKGQAIAITTVAKAEAEAIEIKTNAIKAQGWEDYIQLQMIEAWRAGGSQVPTTNLGTDSPLIFNLK